MIKVMKNKTIGTPAYDRLEELLHDINMMSIEYKTLIDIIPLVSSINNEFINKLNCLFEIDDLLRLQSDDFDFLLSGPNMPFKYKWFLESISHNHGEFSSEISFKIKNCINVAAQASMVSLVIWQHFGLSYNISLKLLKTLNYSTNGSSHLIGYDVLKPIITLWNILKLFIKLTSLNFDSISFNESPIDNDNYYKLSKNYSDSTSLLVYSQLNILNHLKV